MSKSIYRWSDHRDPNKKEISLHDVVMSGFACIFYQEPSLLQFQQEMEVTLKRNNMRTQFAVEQIPSATQLKDVLDKVPSSNFEKIFNEFHGRLQKLGVTKEFQNKLETYFLSVDGTQYYTSTAIHCKKCLTKECKDGLHYSHQLLQSAIVLPGTRVVMPLMPVEISNPCKSRKARL